MDPRQADPSSMTPTAEKSGDAPAPERQNLERERAALRIQAAAVAAQQAALTEQELQVQRQQQAIVRQQEQLAGHLDVRRQRLLELQQRVQQAREELRNDQRAQQEEVREYRARWEQGQSELAEAIRGAKAERQRLQDLRQRLKRRFHRQWAGERLRLQNQEAALAERNAAANRQFEDIRRQRTEMAEERLRSNGERELNGRRLQDAWRRLQQEQKAWKARCASDRGQNHLATAELARLRAELAYAEQESSARRRQAEEDRDRLAREADGLELRVSNLRRKLVEQELQRRHLEEILAGLRDKTEESPHTATEVPMAMPVSRAFVPGAAPVGVVQVREPTYIMETLAHVTDGRSHLLEHCLRLVRVWEQGRQDYENATAELTNAARKLAEREDDLAHRERTQETIEADLRRRVAELTKLQYQSESRQTRLRTGEAAWRAERETLLARVHSREAHAEHQTALVANLRRRWIARHREELDALRAERATCQETQRRYTVLCEETLHRNQALERQARQLALRALSLEEYRLHFISTADNAAVTERRLVRLRQRWDKRFAAAERKLARDTATLTSALNGLDDHMEAMEQLRDDLMSRREALDRDVAAWEHEQVLGEIEYSRLEADRESHQVHRQAMERQLGEERGELERVVHSLLVEGPAEMPVMRAA